MDVQHLGATDLHHVLRQEPVVSPAGSTAAVAAVFRTGPVGTDLLFIQRASKASDPWSGHMAFPGGRTDEEDRDSRSTAERETREELALDLSNAQWLGSLDDLEPGRHLQAVHAHCYWLEGPEPELTPNYEVADAVWVPLTYLTDSARYIAYPWPASGSDWPGIQLDKPQQVVWGLTLRFLANLFDRLDTAFIELAPFRSS